MKSHRMRRYYFTSGLLVIFACLSLFFVAFHASSHSRVSEHSTYTLYADFDNIGGLSVRAPVRIAGVKIGEVSAIDLDDETFQAVVTLSLYKDGPDLPTDSKARILTEGILGSNYVGINPGYKATELKANDTIINTQSAFILENLIGGLMFNADKK